MVTPQTGRDAAHLGIEPAISVILTVINEEQHLGEAISAVTSSSYSGEIEIIIAVGPSRDNTLQIARELAARDKRIRVIDNPSGRTPDGLNAALREATHEIVVRIDGHSEIEPDYIRIAVRTLNETGAVNVGGLMAAEGTTTFERAVARAMRSPIGVGASRFHTGGSAGSVDTVYLGVFKKSAIDAIGGFDSRFTRAQDWEMNYRLRQNGGVVWFNPELKVIYRPRNSLRRLAKQYFEYGRWRRVVSRLHKGTINFRYLAPPVNLLIHTLSILLSLLLSPIFILPLLVYLAAIGAASLVIGKSIRERLLLPLVLITMHFSWGFGFISSPRKLIAK